jgi:uncharacterized DUF497 family protein
MKTAMKYGYEFDPQKEEINKGKHGIDFKQAQALWNGDDGVLELPVDPVNGETRYNAIGTIKGVPYSVIITYVRGPRRRIISARKANEKEIAVFNAWKKSKSKGRG